MAYADDEYRLALYRLAYIARMKDKMCEGLAMLADSAASHMRISRHDHDRAAEGIREIIDDLFYHEALISQHIKETVERETWRNAVKEWSIH